MGVKGLRSLLDSDKRLYGKRLILTRRENNNKESIVDDVIYIDGPALMHHLLRSYWDMLYLDEFYHRAKHFVTCLINAGCRELYLVMEGLAGVEKVEEQMIRLQKKMASCDDIAKYLIRRSNGSGAAKVDKSSDKVPHIFTELILVQSFRNACDEALHNSNKIHSDFTSKVYFAKGEAETAIVALLSPNEKAIDKLKSQASGSPTQIIIFSNDTDFMIYSSSPGFVALNTVEISEGDDNVYITGYFFQRENFCSAFEVPSCILPICALLAGSDYSFPEKYEKRLDVLRQRILSETVSLSRRKKSNPSYKIQLATIFQHISDSISSMEYASMNNESILTHVADILAGSGKGRENRYSDLLFLFNTIANTYGYLDINNMASNIVVTENVLTTFWIDVERIRNRSVFHWRAILERMNQESIFFDTNNTQFDSIISAWQLSQFCGIRYRLHRLLSTNERFTEIGRSKGFSIKLFYFDETAIKQSPPPVSFNVSYDKMLESLAYCLGYRNLPSCFKRLPQTLQPIFVAGLLIPNTSIRLLLGSCMMRIESFAMDKADHNEIDQPVLDSKFINTLAVLQLALYHTVLLAEVFQPLFLNDYISRFCFLFKRKHLDYIQEKSKEVISPEEFR